MDGPLKTYPEITEIPVIDAHMHVFPDKLYRAVRNWFETHAWSFEEEGTAWEFISRQLDRGVAGLVLLPYAHKPGVAESLNEFTAGLVDASPNVVGLAAVHPQDQDPRGVLDCAFNHLGLAGVKLQCHVTGIAPDDPTMDPIYETVVEHGKVMVMHAGKEPSLSAYSRDVRAISGADKVANVLKRHPELKLVVPHLGYDETSRFAELLGEYPNLHLDTTMVVTDYLTREPVRDLLVRHADRILYGTDYPHIPYGWDVELKDLLALELGPEVNQKILHDNAAKLFKLE